MAEAADSGVRKRAARLRDKLTSVRKGHREAADGKAERNGGPRPIPSESPTTTSGPRSGVLRAPGPGGGPGGFVIDKVEDVTPAKYSSATCSRASTTTSRRSACPGDGAQPHRARRPDPLLALTEGAARRCRSRCPSAGTSGACRGRCPGNAGGTHRLPPPAAGLPTKSRPGLSSSRSASAHPPPRCGSSAATMSTSGAATTWAPMVGGRGSPAKSDYRRFLRSARSTGGDDFAAMEEVLAAASRPTWTSGQAARRTPQPLRVPAATARGRRRQRPAVGGDPVLEDLGLEDEIPVASLAKRFEEVLRAG